MYNLMLMSLPFLSDSYKIWLLFLLLTVGGRGGEAEGGDKCLNHHELRPSAGPNAQPITTQQCVRMYIYMYAYAIKYGIRARGE